MMNFHYLMYTLLAIVVVGVCFKSKLYRKHWIISASFLWCGLALLIIGNQFVTIDENNVIHEVGLCLPIGAILAITGLIYVAILGVFLYFAAKNDTMPKVK